MFLLCAQIVDELIRRNDVKEAKLVWLLGLPLTFVIVVVAADLNPGQHRAGLLIFNSIAMLIIGLVLVAIWITPKGDMLPGYPTIILGLGRQIVSGALVNVFYALFHSKGADIFGPIASAITLGIFLFAAKSGPFSLICVPESTT